MTENASALFDIITSRRSIRRYTDRPVPVEVLRRLLEAARWAPSAHNSQPWRFVVITDPAKRATLASAMGERFRADLAADNMPADQIEQRITRSYRRISGAPALIMLCLSMADLDQYPDDYRQQAERIMAMQSVALAAQNLWLAAHDEGLGICWLCAPLFCPDVVRDALALPDDWEAQALLTMGYPAEQPKSDREPLENKTVWY
jgi:coenzyme F420-0:L-glutamate ligase/coenzyme F420-1:gamma-L-glutamate ligase